MADVKTISGFTGAYAEHPTKAVPVWIGDYVLAGYGTGAVMAVPCGDKKRLCFANFFSKWNAGNKNIFLMLIHFKRATVLKICHNCNSDFLDGLTYKKSPKAIEELEKLNQGYGKNQLPFA
jgi:leucyl-tRNA synthetase